MTNDEPARLLTANVKVGEQTAQVLVTLWPDDTAEVAVRGAPSETWGPPYALLDVSPRSHTVSVATINDQRTASRRAGCSCGWTGTRFAWGALLRAGGFRSQKDATALAEEEGAKHVREAMKGGSE